MAKSTIEKLAEKYFKVYGNSPDYEFFAWLSALAINPTEKELKKVLNDEELWEEQNGRIKKEK